MKQFHFNWPSKQNIELDKQLKLLKSLISYSINLNKLEIFSKEPKIEILDGFLEKEQLITEFNVKNSISLETINNYRLFLKAQLMNDFIKNNITEYCDPQKIIIFFNQFNNIRKPIENYWLIKAQKLSQKYSSDFCITIPDFSQTDIISLLINPMTNHKGCIFNEIDIPKSFFNDLYEISQTKETFDQIKIEIFEIIKKYLATNYQTEFEEYLKSKLDDFDDFLNQIQEQDFISNNLQSLFKIIQNVINIGNKIPSKIDYELLDFSDFEDLNNLDFNSYLNKYPNKGFYISQFPEIKAHMDAIYQIWGERKEKFPLELFEFRIFSQFHRIQFQIPIKEANDSLREIQEFINDQIDLILANEEIIFCHFIEFLLQKVPSFFTKTFYSEYVRDIIIRLVTVPKDKTIQHYIVVFLKEFIPKILKKIGSFEWETFILNEELKYEMKEENEIINFLTNPWKYVLKEIDETIRPGYSNNINAVNEIYNKMKNMILTITTEESIKELNKCVNEDIEFYKEKLVQDYNIAKNSIVTEQDVLDKWTIYSQQVSSFISLIPSLPSTSMSKSSPPLLPGQSFDEFYTFFSQNLSSFSNNETRILAFLPKKANSDFIHKLKYFLNGKNVEIHFKITGKVILFSLPYDIQIESLKMESTSILFKVLKIKYNHSKSKLCPSISSLIRSYKLFDEFNNRLLLNSVRVNDCNRIQNEINKVSIAFGKLNVNEFIQKLNQMKSILPLNSFNNINELNDVTNNLRSELIILINVHYLNNEENLKPPKTTNFLSNYLQDEDLIDEIDLDPFMNFLECFPAFSSIYNELDQLIYNSNLFSLSPKVKNQQIICNSDLNFANKMIKFDFSDNFLTPSIFKDENELKTTVKSIEINCDSCNLLPLQIRFRNFTDEELICQFKQENKEFPLLTYKNDHEFLIIEMPVDSIFKKEKNPDEEKTFIFNGKILLCTKYNRSISTEIEYTIKFNYVTESSNLNELKSNFFKVNFNFCLLSNYALFPEKITIASFYSKFNEIINSVYFLPSNIYGLIENDKDDDQAQELLNQLETIYSWQNECSLCFPFCSLQTKFLKALSSTFDQLYKCNLNLSKFPHELIHSKNCIDNNNSLQSKVQINEIGGDDDKDETVLNLNDDNSNDAIDN